MARFICAYCEREDVFNPECGYDAIVNLDNAVSNIVRIKDTAGRQFGIVETLDRQTFFVACVEGRGFKLDEPAIESPDDDDEVYVLREEQT